MSILLFVVGGRRAFGPMLACNLCAGDNYGAELRSSTLIPLRQ